MQVLAPTSAARVNLGHNPKCLAFVGPVWVSADQMLSSPAWLLGAIMHVKGTVDPARRSAYFVCSTPVAPAAHA